MATCCIQAPAAVQTPAWGGLPKSSGATSEADTSEKDAAAPKTWRGVGEWQVMPVMLSQAPSTANCFSSSLMLSAVAAWLPRHVEQKHLCFLLYIQSLCFIGKPLPSLVQPRCLSCKASLVYCSKVFVSGCALHKLQHAD